MKTETIIIAALGITSAFLAFKLTKKNKEIARLNQVILPIAKKVEGATATLADLTPGTVIAM